MTAGTAEGGLEVDLAPGRVEAFSDAVIAIAATLLVLELRPPEGEEGVWHALREQAPSLAAYAVSFLTMLIFWVNHHALFHAVRRVSRPMLFVNGLLLLGVSGISYATEVLGHALESGHDDRSAAVLYALVLGFTAAAFTGLWLCLAARPDLLVEPARPRRVAALRRSLIGPALYGLAALVALVAAPASLALDAAVALYFVGLPRHLRRPPPGAPRAG